MLSGSKNLLQERRTVTCFMPHGSARAQLRHNHQDEVGEVGGEKA